jgi:Domain of unknown function (DUF4331)
MTHHYSGANFGFPRGDARLDLTDLFAFPKPGDASKSILISNVHPSFGFSPQGPTTTEPFAPEGLYELKVDTNGDMVADIAYRTRFSKSQDGTMTATVRRVEGPEAAGKGEEGKVIVQGAPVSMGLEARVTEADPYRFFAGWRSDPFFFDAVGALNNMQFTGEDTFATWDVCSIAMEIPVSALGGGVGVNLWHRTLVQADGDAAAAGGWVQADRGARPSQTPFLASEQRDAYLDGEPAQDERFVAMFAHALEHTGGYSPAGAEAAARSLLPDVLPYDPKKNSAYPGNGRKPTDDGKGVFLTVMNGRLTRDKTGPHTDLLDEFPFLGAPHKPIMAP